MMRNIFLECFNTYKSYSKVLAGRLYTPFVGEGHSYLSLSWRLFQIMRNVFLKCFNTSLGVKNQ